MHCCYFDANMAVGRPRNRPLFTPLATPEELRTQLDRTGLAGALIWHWAQSDGHPASGNALLEPYRTVSDSISVCWALMPPLTAEQGDVLERMRAAEVAAVRLFPEAHRYLMNRVVWRDLLDVLSDCAVPVLLSLAQGCSWQQVYGLLADYPDLTCIICDTGSWSMDRYTYPLLTEYPNAFLETSMLSITDGGVEAAVARFGASRFVFGTGFPCRYVEAAMLQLQHADIADGERQAIAATNMQRLLEESSL